MAKYYIKDVAANTDRHYIDADGRNVTSQDNAVSFDTEDEARWFVDTTMVKFDDWGYISEE